MLNFVAYLATQKIFIMKAIFKISYYLRSNYKNKEGKCPVMVRISLNGKMVNLGSSGLFASPEKWDNKSSRLKFRTKESIQNVIYRKFYL